MPLIEITPPPGVIKPGTVYDAKGRWYDTLWVRWFEGVMQAVGGFEAVQVDGSQIFGGERIGGTHSWRNNSGTPLLAWGGPEAVKVLKAGTVHTVTPASGFTGGSGDAEITSGNYGAGDYGDGLYGVGDTAIETLQEVQSFQMDNYGEDLFFVAKSDGQIWFMDQDGTGGDPALAVVITASTGSVPTGNVGVVVTPERFVMALGASGDGRKIQWPDVDDYTDWAPVAANQAGDINLPGKGAIMAGKRAQAETLVWTDQDIFSVRYIGGNFIYQAVPVGAVGAISRRSMAVVGSVAYWMGPRGFYIYNGYTQAIESPMADYVFSSLNENQASKIWAETRVEFGEIIWHYPSGESTECNRSVTYNYNDGYWFNNTVSRVAGEDSGAFDYPMAFDASGRLWRHESGSFYGYEEDGWEAQVGYSGQPFTTAGGEIYGYSDMSEFNVASGFTEVVTDQNIGFIGKPTAIPVISVANNAVEGNYLYLGFDVAADVGTNYALLLDAFNALFADGTTQKMEILSRQYIGPHQNGGRYGGGACFLTGSTDADIAGFGSGIYMRSTSDYEGTVVISSGGTGGIWKAEDITRWNDTWYWSRVRIMTEDAGSDDDVYMKMWTGDLDDEPAAWTTTSLGLLDRPTHLSDAGNKFGLLCIAPESTAGGSALAYLSFSSVFGDAPQPDITDLTGIKPTAISGPIEIGKGDNVMHIQEIIPDEKTLGDVDMYLYSSFYPTEAEGESGPFTPANPTDVRLTARQVRLKIIEDVSGWRVGTIRADVEMGGKR